MDAELQVTSIEEIYDEDSAVTMPFRGLLSDGSEAVVKYCNNPQGNNVLISELICARIASLLDLSIPPYGICSLYEDVVDETICKDKITENNSGPAFFSSYIRNTVPIKPSIARRVNNKYEYARIMLFDHIIYNADRHESNILIPMGRNSMAYIIDHTHAFKVTVWDQYQFKNWMLSTDYFQNDILVSNKMVYDIFISAADIYKNTLLEECEKIQEILSPSAILEATSEIPQEWFTMVTNDAIASLREYLQYRVLHLHDICNMIIYERGDIL